MPGYIIKIFLICLAFFGKMITINRFNRLQKIMKKAIKVTLVLVFGLYGINSFADTINNPNANPPASDTENHIITPEELLSPQHVEHPWSVMLYGGITANEDLNQVIVFNATSSGESIYSAELAYVFYRNMFSELQIATNGAVRLTDEQSPVTEIDLYLMYRLTAFPWNNYITTTVAVGEGISYASSVPYSEQINDPESHKFLDFMTFEFTAGLPKYPDWQLVYRIHHRSGAYGTFCPFSDGAGSNAMGIGIRYSF